MNTKIPVQDTQNLIAEMKLPLNFVTLRARLVSVSPIKMLPLKTFLLFHKCSSR